MGRSGCGADIKYTVPAGQVYLDPARASGSVPGPQWVCTGWVSTYKSQGHFTMSLVLFHTLLSIEIPITPIPPTTKHG